MRDSVEQSHLQGFAFSKEKHYIEGLSEGLVSPKKGSSKGLFFRHHSRADEAFFKSKQSRLISVLVGTQEGIEKWLKTSGPARCTLWVECAHSGPEDLPPKESNVHHKGLLKFVYRQRDAQAFYQPVLPESTLHMSVIQNAGNKARRGSGDTIYDDGEEHDWTGLRQREIHRRNSSRESEKYLWTRETRWSIVMKVAAFKQLSNMLSPGGALWEFRRLLLQVIDLPEFLDIDVRHLELSEWLAHHPYSVFVTGSDTLVARTTPKGLLVWTILRFDLNKGVILLTKGKHLKDLEQNFGNFDKKPRICDSSDQQPFGANEYQPEDQIGENLDQHPPVCGQLGWKIWRETVKQRDVSRPGPLETTLQSVFEGEADCMVLKSLNTSFSSWKETYYYGCCLSTDLGTAFRDSKGPSSLCGKLSTKERCALSHLRSATREVKLKGLRALLDLLLDVVGDPSITRQKSGHATARKQPRSTPVSSRTQSLMTPTQLQLPKAQDIVEKVTESEEKRRIFFEEKDNLSLLSGLMAVMNRQHTGDHSKEEKEKKFVGSQTERALKAAEMNWTRFEEMKSDRSYASQDRSCMQTRYRLRWERVLEWLDYGFLEALLKEGVSKVCEDQSKDERAFFLDVRELADACTRVVEIVPRESCHRLVICLISLLHKVTEVIVALNIVSPRTEKSRLSRKVPTIEVRGCRTCVGKEKMELQRNLKEKEKLKEAFDEMVCVCRLLSLLVSSSVMVAATLAKENGLTLIFELYSSLVEEFPLSLKPVGRAGEDPSYVLPGEVLEAEELPLKVLRSPASCSRFLDAQCQVEVSDEDGSAHPATNQIVSTSTTGLPWLLLGQAGLEVPLGLRGYKTKKTPATETSILSRISQAFTTTKFATGGRSELDGEGASPEKRRPHVPRLSLTSLPVENTKQEVNCLGHDDAGLFDELLREGENDVVVSSRSATDGVPMSHTIFNIVCEAKLQLLQALASILATNSITLNELRSQLTQKLHEENGAKLVSWFLPDLIGGPLNRFPACMGGKFKKLIFRVLFLLDKSAHDHVDAHVRERKCRVEEAEGPWWSGPGPPPVRITVKRFSDAILVEIQERLDYVLSCLTESLPGCSSPTDIEPIPSCEESINMECHVKAFNSRLWVDLARLAMILSDYVQVSPEKTCKSSDVLKFCRKQITDTLTLLSSLGATASWGPAPILAMQSVLKLFSVCIRDLLSAVQTTEHVWADADFNSLWQMMMETSVYWNCLESYLSWLTLDVCQGCLGILLDDFQKSLQEPVRLYYCALGKKVGMAGISERVFASFQGLEASPKNVFGFLRLVVKLLRRRLDHRRGYMCNDDVFARELPFTFLEGIMNPNDGLLLMAIKQGPQILSLHCEDEPTHLQEADDLTPRQCEQSDIKLTTSKCFSCPWVSQPRGSQRKEALGLCAECANIVTNPNFATDIAMGIQQESLMLLSEIFSLRVMSSESRLPNLNSVNPFLFCKYLNPFLDIVHSGFMNFYKALSEAHTKCMHDDQSSPKDNECCEETELEDQKISNLCCTYAEVLLAVAQNQTEDASQKFRKLCVMEFLVQQITLEYEFSQIAAPRLSRNEVEATSVDQNGLQGMRSSPADARSSSRNEEFLRELCDTSSTSSLTSFRADSDLRAVNQELKNKYTIPAKLSDGKKSLEKEQQSQNLQLGFFSARDKRRFTMAVQQDQFDKSSIPGCKEFMLQKEMKGNTFETPKSILPLLERDEIKRSLSEGGTDSTVTTGSLTTMARELYTDDEGYNRLTRFVTELYNPELVNNMRPKTMTSAEQTEELKGSSRIAAAKMKMLVYSGRFFDLNEEVERELEAEEGDWMHGVRDSNSKGKQLKISSARTSIEMNSAQNFNRIQDLADSSLNSHSLVSGSGSDTGRFMTQIRPMVPKLNFTKAVQKCRPDTAEVSEIGGRTEEIRTCEQYLDRKPKNASASGSKLLGLSLTYEKERWKRRIYQNGRLHLLLLELFISLMLNPEGSLKAYYSDRFPMESSKINAPFFLSYHVNHASNEYVMPQLVKSLEGDKLVSAFRILKLTWRGLFDPSLYTNRVRIAQGAFAQVYTATREKEGGGVTRKELVVLKVVDLPKGPREPCSFFDIYSEVQILELFRGDLRVCQILDYGIDCDTFVLVLKHYKCSLRAWRHRHTSECFGYERDCIAKNEGVTDLPFHERLPLYLEVYAAVLQAVKALEIQNVVHYDLKCDNVLLEPLMSTLSDEEFWHPHWPPLDVTSAIPFRVSITDFGQSKASLCEGGECTVRNRGTECVKSPEMLKLLSTNPDALQTGTSSPEVEISVGKAGDVWGLGCLLYELLTGEYLLYDEDWLQFFMRATSNTEELIPDEKAAKVDNFAPVIDFLRFVLVRDPNDRPTLDDLMEHLEQLQTKVIKEKDKAEFVSNGFDELPATAEQDPATVVGNARPPKETKSPETEHTRASKRITYRKAGKDKKAGVGKQSKFTRLWWRYCACCRKNVELAS